MYGYEAATGLGGLAAQAPGGDRYLASALTIRAPGDVLATTGGMPAGLGSPLVRGIPTVSASGAAVTTHQGHQLGSWREILDWHNSPAPWVLLLILFVYGYVHVSYKRGRVSAGGGL